RSERRARGGFSPRDRSGHDLDPRHPVRCRACANRDRAAGVPPDLSGAGAGRARSGGDLVERGRNRARRAGESRRPRPRRRRDRDHQSARDRDRLGAREAAQAGRLAFGTVDTFLLWRLTGGKVHATDATNAARTLLLDITKGQWDAELCEIFGVPQTLLPEVRDSAGDFGTTDLFGGSIRILGIAGDQQAATVGQGCFEPGMMKSTYGTGCFALLNTGDAPVHSRNRLLTTIAYQLGGRRIYALEGAIFIAGAAVQWLRDALKVIGSAPDVNALAEKADPQEQVYLVPAFVGLGAPWWDAQARGAIFGLTRNAGAAEN